jgi:HD-GYP domain-containing protein (c-di-GMP phosphodiesterase class II)
MQKSFWMSRFRRSSPTRTPLAGKGSLARFKGKSSWRRRLPHLGWLCFFSIVFCAALDIPQKSGRAGNTLAALSYFEQYAYSVRMVIYGTQRRDLVRAARNKIVLVTITDNTFQSLPKPSGPPIPRQYHAQVVRELSRAGAKVIAFDLLFDQPRDDNPEGNEALAAAAEPGNVLWAAVSNNVTGGIDGPIPPFYQASPHLGHINAGDLVLKQLEQPLIDRLHLVADDNGKKIPAFSLMAARMLVGATKRPFDTVPVPDSYQRGQPSAKIPLDDAGTFKISFLGGDGNEDVFARIPYEAIYRGEAQAEFYTSHQFFKNKIVLIGDDTTFGKDYRYTPIGQMAGVEIHAHAIATLLSGEFIKEVPSWLNLALIVAMGAAVGPLAASGRLQRLIVGVSIILCSYFLINIWLFVSYGWWLHLVGPSAALVLSTAFVVIERGFFEEREKERMFDALVSAAGSAIERRDPSTSGHSQRVTALTIALAEAVSRQKHGPFQHVRFSLAQIKELRYAGLLHDFGKIGVRENVLTKSHKLEPRHFEAVMGRLLLARQAISLHYAERRLELLQNPGPENDAALAAFKQEQREKLAQLDNDLRALEKANDPMVTYLPDQQYAELQSLLSRLEKITVRDASGEEKPIISDAEKRALSIRRGTLTPEEYREVQRHAALSFDFLEQIPWTDALSNIPEIARAHHEKLNGSGYPRGLMQDEIPLQARMMTIADIYDALTAADRPYKKAMPVDKALHILRSEANEGALDVDLLDIFIEHEIYAVTDNWSYVPRGPESLSGFQAVTT